MSFACRSGHPLGELAPCFIDGHNGVRPLVRDSNDGHIRVSLFAGG